MALDGLSMAESASMGKMKAIVASYVGVLLFAGVVFLGAWKAAYGQGLLYVVLALAGTTLSHILVPAGSTITADRAREARAGRDWDRRLLGAYFLVNVVTFLTAGLDSGRFGWTGDVPIGVTVAGAALMLSGQVLFAVAKRQNAFFSSTVRIQTERGHQVCDTGLYRFVRHPGYLGMLMSLLAFPLVMNSYWAFVPAGIGAALLVVRTVLEDRFLVEELPGYADYTNKTRSRLLPGLF
jgi:protein-S-isoprenylcysteine O-methyltransferase Ste14